MYTKLKQDETWKINMDNFKLCYIKKVQGEVFDDDYHVTKVFDDDYLHFELFFTNCDMKYQWGDDWDDSGYEYESGEPYDDHYIDDKKMSHEIIKLEVALKTSNGDGWAYYYDMPCDFSYGSKFRVEMINAGVIAWLTISSDDKELMDGSKFVILYGGEPMENVIKKLKNFMVNEEK